MSLDDTLRWASAFPMRGRWPDTYDAAEPDIEPNWAWVRMWEAENPRPDNLSDHADWWDEHQKMQDRVWVATCLPQFRVFDWSDDDVAHARRMVSRHVCAVCGRPDDSGCALGC